MNKRILAALTAVIVALTLCLPAFAADRGPERHTTPAGYNDNDYQKMAAFLDTPITLTYMGFTMTRPIYQWIQMVDSGFSMNDPSTWSVDYNGVTQFYVTWRESGGEQRLSTVWADPTVSALSDYSVGSMDLSGCTALMSFSVRVMRLESLDLSGCSSLYFLTCRDNYSLASINLTGCTMLNEVDLTNCALTSIDLSSGTIPFNSVTANGNGTIGFRNGTAYAYPAAGSEYFGWYSSGGALLSTSAQLDMMEAGVTSVTARFTGAVVVIPGDADGDGEVAISDALMVLRAALGLTALTPEQAAVADVNGDGEVGMDDALAVLRLALGLISSL